jgi:hypothetical protein
MDAAPHILAVLQAPPALPPVLHVLAVALVISGLLLWLAGARVLKPGLIGSGAIGGGILGAVIAPLLLPALIFGVSSVYTAIAVGVILGLVLSIALFRLTVAVAGTLVLTAAATLGTLAYLSRTPDALPALPEVPSATSQPPGALESAKATADQLRNDLAALLSGRATSAEPQAQAVRAVLDQAKSTATTWWGDVPSGSRVAILTAAALGGLLGFVGGVLAPRKMSAVVTAPLGAALVIGAGLWIAQNVLSSAGWAREIGPVGWAGVWLAASALGMFVQLMTLSQGPRPRPAATA